MLIVFSGLPGTGKTTLAKRLAHKLCAVYLRIDSLEQALVRAGNSTADNMGPAGYFAGYAVALDNLRLGLSVVADSVNPVQATREAWQNVASHANTQALNVEVVCSDKQEHQHRVEKRGCDIEGLHLPSWHDVCHRKYELWTKNRFVVDTAHLSPDNAVQAIIAHFQLRTKAVRD